MNTEYIRERMGADATTDEAEAMVGILTARGLEIDTMSDEDFFALIPEAIAAARDMEAT